MRFLNESAGVKLKRAGIRVALCQPMALVTEGAAAQAAATILVVDDSRVMCEVARKALQSVGYEVLYSTDGYAALETCRRHSGPIDLLLTDVVMPGLDGRELAERVTATRPDTRVLFMSGIVTADDLFPGRPFLAKPYGYLDLVRKVEEILAA